MVSGPAAVRGVVVVLMSLIPWCRPAVWLTGGCGAGLGPSPSAQVLLDGVVPATKKPPVVREVCARGGMVPRALADNELELHGDIMPHAAGDSHHLPAGLTPGA